jgi:predicted adenylyl cyclase CyaB
MDHTNIEIKARSSNHTRIREILALKAADYRGRDHQLDTYFYVPSGRLKLRKGNIENSLIYYDRENIQGPKQSNVALARLSPNPDLRDVLAKALGVLVVVDKQREIYFVDNVKIHLDSVRGLGDFCEIEAIDEDGSIGTDALLEQCQHYIDLFGIAPSDLVSTSYSDLLLERNETRTTLERP